MLEYSFMMVEWQVFMPTTESLLPELVLLAVRIRYTKILRYFFVSLNRAQR
jgi:hypothetical protein